MWVWKALLLASSEPKLIKCDLCEKVFQNPGGLEMHKISHRSCEICGEKFSGNRSLQNYSNHLKKHARAVECKNCRKLFKNKTAYLKHFKIENCTLWNMYVIPVVIWYCWKINFAPQWIVKQYTMNLLFVKSNQKYKTILQCTRSIQHSVEISWFFYHSDFTWNQFHCHF